MLRTVDERPFRLIFLGVFLGLVVALGVAGYDTYFNTDLLEVGDPADNALQIDNAKHGTELYGNYSRFQFNHPGPAFFYVYAAGERLFYDTLHLCKSPGSAHLLTCMILQSAFFALTLAILSEYLAWRVVLPIGLLAAALHFGYLRQPFMSIWPPHVLLMPFLAFLASCISFASGRLRHSVLMVLTGGFLFHGHVAQPLFVAGLGGLALAVTSIRIRKSPDMEWRAVLRDNRSSLIICGAIIALFLLPLAIDILLLGTRSNVATIIGRFYANTDDSKSAVQSLLYFVSFGTYASDQDVVFTKMGPQVPAFFAAHAAQLLIWAAIFFIPPVVAYALRHRLSVQEKRFFGTAYLFLGATVVLCILWGKAQAGAMANYNGYFYYGIYYFAFVLGLGVILRSAERLSWSPVAAAICAAAAVAFTTLLRIPPWSADETNLMMKNAVASLVKSENPTKPKFLVFEHRWWPPVAGVAVYLQRHHIPFYMQPEWEFMFSWRHDSARLGDTPEKNTDVWWITNPGEGGIPITPELSIFTKPAALKPSGDEFRFRGGDNGFRYVVTGVTVGNTDYAWTNLKRVVFLFAPQHADRDVQLIFDAESGRRNKAGEFEGVPAEVIFNGQSLGQIVAHERSELRVTVPAALWNQAPDAKLELHFPQTIYHRFYKRPRYEEWLGWGLWKVRTEYAP